MFNRLDSKNALISGFSRKGDGETALKVFAEMQRMLEIILA